MRGTLKKKKMAAYWVGEEMQMRVWYLKNSYNSTTKTKSDFKREDKKIDIFQRRHTDGQHTHEKMLDITNQQGKPNEIPPHTFQNNYQEKDKK